MRSTGRDAYDRSMSSNDAQTTASATPTAQDSTAPESPARDLSALSIAVIGAGNMGGPVVRAFLAAGADPQRLAVVNSTDASSERAAAELGVTAPGRRPALESADVVVLGVKPYQLVAQLREIRDLLREDAVVVSLAAGISLSTMQEVLGEARPILRAMPNTPISIGEGAVGIMRGSAADDDQTELVHALFARAGVVVPITEDQIHAFIAAAGSLSAIVFALVEAMVDEGVRQGLTRDLASSLVQQTMRGASTMLLEDGTHPAVARNAVSSPGGTTAEGLAEFDRQGVRPGVAAAMAACARRSREMTGD